MQVDHDEVAVAKLIGSRMAEARMLCKLPRHIAADRLDVSAQELERIENGVDVERVSLKLVRQASLVYDVTTDFLYGFSTDWEVCAEVKIGREIGAYLHVEQAKLFSGWAVKQMRLEQQVEALTAAVNTLRLEVAEIFEALDTFRERNPNFDTMPAGATLVHRVEKANRAAQSAYRALHRCKAATK
jgi:transcriptional regulator with XRE-family HTH domain